MPLRCCGRAAHRTVSWSERCGGRRCSTNSAPAPRPRPATLPVASTGSPRIDRCLLLRQYTRGVIEIRTIGSPIGALTLAVRGGRLCVLHFGSDGRAIRASLRRWYPDDAIDASAGVDAIEAILTRYFAGETDALDVIDVEMNGTSFQRRVWAALRDVKAGTTVSYGEIARRIGAPSAVRAVGAANGANP